MVTNNILYAVLGCLVGVVLTVGLFYVGLAPMPANPASQTDAQEPQVVSDQNTEVIERSFPVPSGRDYESVDLVALDAIFEAEELPAIVEVPLPAQIVGQSYSEAFNLLINNASRLEVQMRSNVANALFDVQKEAAAGNYLVMFENILIAKKVVATAYVFASETADSATALEDTIATDVSVQSVQTASKEMIDAALTFTADSVGLLDAASLTIDGSVPSQELLDTIDLLSLKLDTSAGTFARSVANTSRAMKQAR
ncbi:MAG: hypothetical protein ACI9H6_000764 [Patiriisocius sp.]|jgi:hypothetical protein